MSNSFEELSFNTQIYIFIVSALIVLLVLVILCVNCNKKRRVHRSKRRQRQSSDKNRFDGDRFVDVPLELPAPHDRSLSTFLASAQNQMAEEKSVVKQALFGLVTERFDEPAVNPRKVDFIGRKSVANIQKIVPNFHQHRTDVLERQYMTVDASFKFSPDEEKNLEIIYANFETLTANSKKKDSFGSEQMISKKSLIEEPPVLVQRFTVQRSVDAIQLEPEGAERKKINPYEHLHINDEKKKRNQYENHEIISKNRAFVS